MSWVPAAAASGFRGCDVFERDAVCGDVICREADDGVFSATTFYLADDVRVGEKIVANVVENGVVGLTREPEQVPELGRVNLAVGERADHRDVIAREEIRVEARCYGHGSGRTEASGVPTMACRFWETASNKKNTNAMMAVAAQALNVCHNSH